MADFLWSINDTDVSRFDKLYGGEKKPLMKGLSIFGREGTYTINDDGDDFACFIGYCAYPGESIQNTSAKILKNFNETTISDLKKELTGQYILLIKKSEQLFILADFWHTRNIFYSEDFSIMSSSFSIIEQAINTDSEDLDIYKVFEFLSFRKLVYPSWLGGTTINKRIKFLRPFEYIMIDLTTMNASVKSVNFLIDNRKESNLEKLSSTLLADLKEIIQNPEYKDRKIGVTLTGGYDSRLVGTIAVNYYKNANLRLATANKSVGSMRDLKISRKLSRIFNVPLSVQSEAITDTEEEFYFLTEGLSPLDNSVLLPIIRSTDKYALGLGGCFGTELFHPIVYKSTEKYIEGSIKKVQECFYIKEENIRKLKISMLKEFEEIKNHYILSLFDPTDMIRVFIMLRTAFFSAPMLSAFNVGGLQLEPYGHFKILKLAFKIPEKYYGRIKNFRNHMVQKKAMERLSFRVGLLMTTHKQPMLPYSFRNLPFYFLGRISYKIGRRFRKRGKVDPVTVRETIIGDLRYFSDGWDSLFLRRLHENYRVKVKTK